MINHNLCAGVLTATIALAAGTAQAATYTASQVIEDQTAYGTCSKLSRKECKKSEIDSRKALGEMDGEFYTLGLGGQLTLAFDSARIGPGATVTVQEYTYNRPASSNRHYEAVDVYSIFQGVTTFVDTVFNTAASTTLYLAQGFEYLRFVDVTTREFGWTRSFNGFDVDSVTVDTSVASIAPVPLPAGGGLLLAGLGAFGLLRKRKAAA